MNSSLQAKLNSKKIVVLGAGPVGVRFCIELLARQADREIVLIGNEPYIPYNRVQLSAVLAGSVARDAIDLSMPQPQLHKNFSYVCTNICHINRQQKSVVDKLGVSYSYDVLVLAVGSHPFLPNIPGIDSSGVYTFRNLKDTDSLYARLASKSHLVVVGGGLLGIEAARALAKKNTRVTLVHHSERLMNRQLDNRASELLQAHLSNIDIKLDTRITHIFGESRVEGIELRSLKPGGEKTRIDCNTVIISTGIRPNTDLALNAKLDFGRGIKIRRHLDTSDPSIYAIGECVEFEDQIWGLVSPGYEQASVLADRLSGGSSEYFGSSSMARLKVVEKDLCSIGDIDSLPTEPGRREIVYENIKRQEYRKILLKRGRLIGALGFGEWDELPRIQETLTNKRKVSLTRQLWFRFTGQLWPGAAEKDIRQWPSHSIVCQCNTVTVEDLLTTVDAGVDTIEGIKERTKAGTGCGSCEYLLEGLCKKQKNRLQEPFSKLLLAMSILVAIVAALQFFMPGLSPASSVQNIPWFERIWHDKFYKQVTGFSLLAITIFATVLSLRKRLKLLDFGDYKIWRAVHTVLGLVGVSVVIVHTGFHLGNNLNNYLILNFLAVSLMGALTGAVVSRSHQLSTLSAKRLREFWFWAHILLAWPLPVLIGLHIFSVYYY